ncbi:hypothetical protein ROLI_044530 [Roseobacter fucihabitans]|uniref:HPr kinase n=1 Tax=Roseobacter fucihabitans TaxID=1537242 RepID=A0ABZ2BZ22_9RHOB|nr:hypothetical protein [Roseobacter litoralis]MBC6963932.1 hypothetical protein [Roseobacter litoralis]MBC6963983.1 hypothetical protein [Roseobacter litoralis]
MTQHYYSVFGLTLASEFMFDVLDPIPPVAHANTLKVKRRAGIHPDAPPAFDPYFDIQPERQFLHWKAVGTFIIEDPNTVLVEPQEGVSDHLLSQAFLGLVISLVLERRGILCLHASAVSVNNRAALFLGDKGAGKSTTNAALLARGHVPITDDLVAVDRTLTEVPAPVVWPGFSSMKLWPDTVEALALKADEGDRLIHPSVQKVQKRMPTPLATHPVPMGGLFVLRRSADVISPSVIPRPAHEALQMVMRYTFMARYGETRLGREHLGLHLKRCGAVVANAPVYDLMVPADLSQLNALCEVIERIFDPAG